MKTVETLVPVALPMALEEDGEQTSSVVMLSSSLITEGDENSENFVSPPQTIISNPSTTVSSLTSSNAIPLGYIESSEDTQLLEEIKKLNVQLVLAQQKITEHEAEINMQNSKLMKATDLIAEQQGQLDKRFGFSCEKEVKDRDVDNLKDLKELKNLVAQERKQRLEAEEKFAKLKTSLKQMNEEYSLFFEEVKVHLIGGEYEAAGTSKGRLDQLSKFVEQRFEKWMKEQIARKAAIKGLNKVILNLMEIINSQRFNESTASPPAKDNVTSKSQPYPNPKVISRQQIKAVKIEQTTIKASPRKTPQKFVESDKEHAEDISKSIRGFFCICGVEYSSKGNLAIHIRQLTEEGKFNCHICHEKFVLFYMLRRHLESKHNIKPKKGNGAHCVGCMDCGKTFISQSHLWKHRKSVHSQASVVGSKNPSTSKPAVESHENDEDPPVAKKSMSLAKKFVTPKILNVSSETVSISGKKHGMNIAKRHRGFYCICGIKFISRKSLDGHVRFQNKDTESSSFQISKYGIEHKVVSNKPLQCICGFRSANKYSTIKHVVYHTTERKFPCDLCPKRFLNMSFLRNHYIKSHKLSKDIALGTGCTKCGITFETMREYHVHYRTVHGNGSSTKRSVEGERGTPTKVTTAPSSSPTAFSTPFKTEFGTTGLSVGRPRRELRIKDEDVSLNEQDSDDPFEESSPLSPQPIPIPIYFEDDDDEEMPVMLKLEPGTVKHKVPRLAVKQEVDEDYYMKEDPSSSDILKEVHEHDTTRRSKFFYCTCGNRFRTKKILGVHIKQKTEKWNFQCEICKKLFFYNSTLKVHMIKVHKNVDVRLEDENIERMDLESNNEKSRAILPLPSKVSSEEEEEELPTAPPVETKSPKLTNKSRQQSHGNDTAKQQLGLFFCICGKNCINEIRLQNHISYSNRDLKYPCDICGSRFAFQSVLRRHLEQSHKFSEDSMEKLKFPCTLCEQSFSYRSVLARHLERSHKIEGGDNVEEASSTSRVKSQIQCKKCRKRFETQEGLLQHNKLFHKLTISKQPAKSRIRKKKAIDRNSVHHQVSSRSPDMYTCACGLMYTLKSSLSKHISKQSRGKIFKCSYCPKAFVEASNVRIHTKAVHGIDLEDNRHGCGICGKMFPSFKERRRHRIRVHGTRR